MILILSSFTRLTHRSFIVRDVCRFIFSYSSKSIIKPKSLRKNDDDFSFEKEKLADWKEYWCYFFLFSRKSEEKRNIKIKWNVSLALLASFFLRLERPVKFDRRE